jgi:hypothetical protein
LAAELVALKTSSPIPGIALTLPPWRVLGTSVSASGTGSAVPNDLLKLLFQVITRLLIHSDVSVARLAQLREDLARLAIFCHLPNFVGQWRGCSCPKTEVNHTVVNLDLPE